MWVILALCIFCYDVIYLFLYRFMDAALRADSMGSSDEQLLQRAKANPEGVGAIYDAYADMLYGFFVQRCGQKELAEDFVSKVFIKFI